MLENSANKNSHYSLEEGGGAEAHTTELYLTKFHYSISAITGVPRIQS